MISDRIHVSLVFIATFLTFNALADDDIIDTGSVQLIRVSDSVYAVSPKFAGANGALIVDEAGSIVVDTHGSPASAQALIDASSRISDAPIRYVVNTHWHVDHHSGNTAYRNEYGKDVVFVSHDITRDEIPTLGAEQFEQAAQFRETPIQAADEALEGDHGGSLDESQRRAIREFRDQQSEFVNAQSYDYVLADLTFSESITLHGDNSAVEIFYLYPGHTEADSIAYVRDEEILIVGDLLTQPIIWTWASHPSSYVKTLQALEALPVKKIVVGHGGPVLEGKAYLTHVRQFLEAVVSYSQNSSAKGIDTDAAIGAAASHSTIQSFRRGFVTEEQDSMFDQMVGWTITRALDEIRE